MASKLAVYCKILGGLLFAALVANCSISSEDALPGAVGFGGRAGSSGIDGSAPDEYVHDVRADVPDDTDSAPSVNPLCGKGCIPDQKPACVGHDAGRPDAADAMADASDDRLEGSAPDAGKLATYACYVSRAGSGPMATCEVAGSGKAEDPCLSSRDCAPGLACVGDGAAAQCRPFCCTGGDVCEPRGNDQKSTYCAERPLREQPAYAGAALSVPVCVVADNCDLAQPYPCPSDALNAGTCTCKDEKTACMVVRADGSTSCIVPDKGQTGDACPCGWGHICSQATDKCVKICAIASTARECGGGKCQGSANLPPNFGVCVGDMNADAR